MNTRRFFSLGVRVGISVFLIWFLIANVDTSSLVSAIRSVSPTTIIAAALLLLLNVFLNSIRWKLILQKTDIESGVGKLFLLNLANFFYGFALPGGKMSADVVRTYHLARMTADGTEHVPTRAILGSVLDRAVGVLSFGLMAAIILGFGWGSVMPVDSLSRTLLALSLVVSGTGLIGFFTPFLDPLLRALQKVPGLVKRSSQFALEALTAYRREPKTLLLSLLVSIAANVVAALSLLIFSSALSLPLSFPALLLFYAIAILTTYVPITVGGIGLREGALVYLIVHVGVSAASALSLTLLYLGATLILVALGGTSEFIHSLTRSAHHKAPKDSPRAGLLFIIPEYNPLSPTHFSYLPEFIEKIAKVRNVTLIVLTGAAPLIPNVLVRVVGRAPVLSFLKLIFFILQARFSGVVTAYVHYSFSAAFLSSLTMRMLGGHVFYWNCGLPWQYQRSVFREWFERATYHAVSHLVTGTEKLADQYAKVYRISRRSVVVMPNWIDVRETENRKQKTEKARVRRELGIHEGEKMVLFAHRLSERKGAQYLPNIIAATPQAKFIVAGAGPLRGGLEKEIRNRGLGSRVQFLGSVPHQALLARMAESDIFIMPSDEEGFPHVLLEAMALGVPFVATRVGGVAEMVPPEALQYVVPSKNPHAFSSALNQLLLLPSSEREQLVRANRMWVERFDIEKVTARFLELVA